MRHTFYGGVYPPTTKQNTRRKPISELELAPEEVAIPLVMCPVGQAQPIVKPGDRVSVGQCIAHGGAQFAPIHASVSGVVTAIEERPHPWGGSAPAIIIHNDGRNTPWDILPAPLRADELTPELLLERVEEAGIVGMGGGAYPTAAKLAAAVGKADTLIINAAECEPYVTADYRLLMEHSERILQCAAVLARCLGVKHSILVTEGDKLKATELMERRLRKRTTPVELCTVRTRYPLGAEKQIIQTATGREVPPGGSPLDVKCVVLNLATVYAIWGALFGGRPLTHRVVTVSGGAVSRPRNLWVPIGTPLRRILEDCGGLREESALMLLGGPMMGIPVPNLDAPVVKNTNSLICLADWERKPKTREVTCIRCGKCISACPMHLAPAFINRALQEGDMERLTKLHVEDCHECGCCSYICPAGISLVEQVKNARELLKKGGDI